MNRTCHEENARDAETGRLSTSGREVKKIRPGFPLKKC
jgi:hypothetical protein